MQLYAILKHLLSLIFNAFDHFANCKALQKISYKYSRFEYFLNANCLVIGVFYIVFCQRMPAWRFKITVRAFTHFLTF